MPDDRSPIRHHVVLNRRDPEQRVARFYALMIERDLFGAVRLVCHWGRVGARGQEIATEFPTEEDAAESLEALVSARRRQGYQDL